MPASLVEDNHGVGARIDRLADLGEMRCHRRSVRIGHDQPGALALLPLNIRVDTTAEDGDGDIDPASAEVTVIDDENTFLSVDDDGLDVTVSADATPGELAALDLNLDETIDLDDDNTADGADV